MHTRAINVLFPLVLPLCSSGQTVFQAILGDTVPDHGTSVQQTADGGYILAGKSFCVGPEQAYLMKVDAIGSLVNVRHYGGGAFCALAGVRQAADGGYLAAGYTYAPGSGGKDVLVMKTLPGLGHVWSRAIGGTAYDEARGIRELAGGGCVVVGYTNSFSAGGSDLYVMQLDAGGTLVWTRTFGGLGNEDGHAVQQTSDGGYIVAGSTESWGAGQRDVLLIRTDASGNTVWQRAIGGSGADEGHSVVQCADGGFVVAGATTSFGAGAVDAYMVKVDSLGSVLWSSVFGDTGNDQASAVERTADGGFFLAGYSESFGPGGEAYLIRTDSSGTLLWSKIYGGVTIDLAAGLDHTADGGVAMLGVTFSFSSTDADFYLIKTDAQGNSGCNELTPSTQYAQVTSAAAMLAMSEGTGGIPDVLVPVTGSVGTAQPLCLISPVEEYGSTEVVIGIHPVPSFGLPTITLTMAHANVASVMVCDALGRALVEHSAHLAPGAQSVQLGMVDLRPGLYLLRVVVDGTTRCQRFEVEGQ